MSYNAFAAGALDVRSSRTTGYPGWPRHWAEPAVESWRWLLKEAEEPNFETRIGLAYRTDHMFRGHSTWPDDSEIPLEERIFLLLLRDLNIDHCRALQGLLHTIRNWHDQSDPLVYPVAAVALADSRRGSDAYVVLTDEATNRPRRDVDQLNGTLRETVRPIWSPAHIHFVDRLPASEWRIG